MFVWKKIDKSRLNAHKELVRKLNKKREIKHEIEQSLGIKAYDYSKDKIINGSKRPSEQERFVIRLEKINKEIKELEKTIFPAQEEIESQIKRVGCKNWKYEEILRSYYIDDIPKEEIMEGIYSIQELEAPNIEKSFEKLKMRAIEALAKVSETPFIEIEQIPIEDFRVET